MGEFHHFNSSKPLSVMRLYERGFLCFRRTEAFYSRKHRDGNGNTYNERKQIGGGLSDFQSRRTR